MKLFLIGWHGHGNLGDDAMYAAMVRYAQYRGHSVVEKQEEADWVILIGGTLIAQGSGFVNEVKNPSRCVGFSLGVSEEWVGAGRDELIRMPKLYTRDHVSHWMLAKQEIQSTLSFDLLCASKPPAFTPRSGIALNLVKPYGHQIRAYQAAVEAIKERLMFVPMFSMAEDDLGEGKRYTEFATLLTDLASYSEVYVSRLHALVAAWIAEVPVIHPLIYDQKLIGFLNRVAGWTQEEVRTQVRKDLEELFIYMETHVV